MSDGCCTNCEVLRVELGAARQRAAVLAAEVEELRVQLHEAVKLAELQRADIERYKAAYERVLPNTPERVPKDQLQLAFSRVLEAASGAPAALAGDAAALTANSNTEPAGSAAEAKKAARPHGRRKLDITSLPVEYVGIDPEEVVAANGEGFECIGEEVSDRIAFKRGGYVRLRSVRRKWVRKDKGAKATPAVAASFATTIVSQGEGKTRVLVAPMPESLWPTIMADPSAIAQIIISKYDDSLPLNRQEKISARNGFVVPRSTQCDWLGAAHQMLHRIVAAMRQEALATSFCIATDATGAPVRTSATGKPWHIFVLVADHNHVLFDYTEHQTSVAVQQMLAGFRGYLLADAAIVYEALYKSGDITEVGCWFHQRRYFWRALTTEPTRALEAMSLIAKLFEIEGRTRGLSPPERTPARASAARPILDLFDAWVARNRAHVDAGGRLEAAITYYDNQREALHRFLADGRLRLDNSISERQLRNVALGRHNWMSFENETGLRWYTVFRSLIASCGLHGINAHDYLEQVLRLAPHWSARRVLELAPRYWKATLAKLDVEQRAIIERPWERGWPVVTALHQERAAVA